MSGLAQQIISDHNPNMMIGTPGTGKTHLSASILRNILHNSTKSARYYTSAKMLKNDGYLTMLRALEEVIDHFSSFDLLVIDEYGLHDRHEKRRRWCVTVYMVLTI